MTMTEIWFYNKPEYIKSIVTELKKKETLAEKLLWDKIRAQRFNNYKFYRQKAIFVYRDTDNSDRFFIADFYHHPKKIIIEIDWSIHNKDSVREYDKLREYLLKKAEYKIIRFTNDEVLSNIDNVLSKIYIEIIRK